MIPLSHLLGQVKDTETDATLTTQDNDHDGHSDICIISEKKINE